MAFLQELAELPHPESIHQQHVHLEEWLVAGGGHSLMPTMSVIKHVVPLERKYEESSHRTFPRRGTKNHVFYEVLLRLDNFPVENQTSVNQYLGVISKLKPVRKVGLGQIYVTMVSGGDTVVLSTLFLGSARVMA